MISEEDVILFNEAKKCSTCVDWLKHCNSECCKVCFLNVSLDLLKGNSLFIDIGMKHLMFTDIMYYKLRGVRYTRGILRFPRSNIRVIGRKVLYVKSCSWLVNGLCKGHPDKKPLLCKSLTLKTSRDRNTNFKVTDNCLFKYKVE